MFAKISKKVVAVALVATMAVTTATVASDNTASAALKKKASVVQGKEVKLNAGASATWTSSNDNIAHCQKTKGKSIKVLGIKKGTATITATVGGKKQTCKVSVKNAKKGTVIYNFAKSTNPDNHTKLITLSSNITHSVSGFVTQHSGARKLTSLLTTVDAN